MKQWVSVVLACYLVAQASFAFALNNVELKPQVQQSQAAKLTAEFFSQLHYKPVMLNDKSSNIIFNKYIKSLDSEHLFFLQQDINAFSYARTKLDNALLEENLAIPFSIFNLYKNRVAERITYAKSLLNKPFNFSTKESYQYEREDALWATDIDALNDIWRKRVKNDWLRLKIAGKDAKNITETLEKRYNNSLNSINKIKSNDVFQSFMNAYATSIDPHTNYFGVRAAEDFNISMRLSLVGIGAVLQSRDEYTLIRKLVAGGPAERSGKLNVGDRIVGVAQGESAQMVEVIGWRLDDTVDLIRGEQDSTVILDILPADAGLDDQHKHIVLVRDKINLEQQAAKKSIIEIKDGHVQHKIGVIELPVFYQDFYARQQGDQDFKSATRDVRNLINALKQEKVDSILIDLRNNGGGSLDEAIDLTGLFIDKGPILQERDVRGSIKIDRDNDAGVTWDGSLGVLINRGSASASEIFAAAIQDYGRGIIIGELSYGKGTVQTVYNLDRYVKNTTPKFGEIKMTIAQFFRINGGTTQLRGVNPDVHLPSLNDLEKFGESSYENALPWSMITPAVFSKIHNLQPIFPQLINKHQARIKADQDFQFLNDDIAKINLQRQKKSITLNEAERRKERKEQELALAERKKQSKEAKNSTLLDDGLLASERNLENELAKEQDAKDKKDILLNEAAHILSDSITILNNPAINEARIVKRPNH